MMMTSCVIQMFIKEKPPAPGEPILMRGDNASAVSWVNRCGGSRDRRAGLIMRMMGRIEVATNWCPIAKHIRGVENVLADGISRWPANEVQARILQLTGEEGWKFFDIGSRGNRVFDIILQDPFPKRRLDDEMWSAITAGSN